jgi:hypothetical protein
LRSIGAKAPDKNPTNLLSASSCYQGLMDPWGRKTAHQSEQTCAQTDWLTDWLTDDTQKGWSKKNEREGTKKNKNREEEWRKNKVGL